MEASMRQLKKDDVVKYLMYRYKNLYNSQISPIKLQKGLYFLFAYWGAYMKNGQKGKTEVNEELNKLNPVLFDADFQAWAYGPVDENVYKAFRDNKEDQWDDKHYNEFISKQNDIVISFLTDYTQKIFNTGDFTLVDLSHRDKCWQNHYNSNESYHNSKIPSKEIIDEYSSRT